MTPDDFEQLIHRVLDQRTRIDQDTHTRHHEWVAARVADEARRQGTFDKIVQHVLGWGIVAGIAWLGLQVLDGLKRTFN